MKKIYVIVWQDFTGEFGLVQAYARLEGLGGAEEDLRILNEEKRGERTYEIEVVDYQPEEAM